MAANKSGNAGSDKTGEANDLFKDDRKSADEIIADATANPEAR
jgi:hypothetical protein